MRPPECASPHWPAWAEEVHGGRQEGPGPLQYLWGAIRVIGPSWKMLNQPPVSPLTLAMTENYYNCCHQMSDFKAKNTPNLLSDSALPQTQWHRLREDRGGDRPPS